MGNDAVLERLRALADSKYRTFQAGLIPNIDPGTILGVRMPALRAYAKELGGSAEANKFMSTLPYTFYDEYNLHGLLINRIADYSEAVAALEKFLPYVDNWATCDLLSPKAFKRHPAELPAQIERWIRSGKTYTTRFGIGILLEFYLDDNFDPAQLELAASACCEEYYVNMMVAWYFATALAKQRDATLPWLTEKKLPVWVHNKTIQKAIESRRIEPGLKDELRKLRRK